MRRILLIPLVAVAGLCCLPVKSNGAYKLFTNGTIYIDAYRTVTNLVVLDIPPTVTNLPFSSGSVVALNADPASYPGATNVDLQGGVAYPGFNDSHCHLMEVGAGYNWLILSSGDSVVSICQKVKIEAELTTAGKAIMAVGFSLSTISNTWSLANLAALDAAAGNHPAFILDDLGHDAIVNTMVMSNYNITATSSVPLSGVIVTEDGKPTGLLREAAMQLAGQPMLAAVPNETVSFGTELILADFASYGYTSINDMMGGPMGTLPRPQLYRDMEALGKLPLRVNYAYTIFGLDQVEGALTNVGKDTEMVRFLGVKLFVDGAFAAGQAWTTWTNLSGNNGKFYVGTNDVYGTNYNLNRIVEKVDDLKLNIHYHVQGDAGMDAIMNAMDAVVAKKGGLRSVHTLVHVAFPRADQILRMKGFGTNLATTVQPALWKLETNANEYYGDRMTNSYPDMVLINGGLTVGMSTDFAVSPVPDPLAFMFVALTPTNWTPPTRTAMTMPALINGLTAGSAATTTRKDIGTLEVGNKADMVVYNYDLYSLTPQQLTNKTAKVLSTWVGGKLKHDSKAAPKISSKTQGSRLTLAWPMAQRGWTLQGQTNAPSFGLGTNWVAVPTVTNQFIMPISQKEGAVFFRLVAP